MRAATVLLAAACVGCAGSGSGGPGTQPLYLQSISHMVAIEQAMTQYENDYDDYLPTSGQWMDQVKPYLQSAGVGVLHSPALPGSEYGYALNSSLAGLNEFSIADPSTVPLVFDSTVTSYNATAAPSTLPNPPRYSGKNTEGFADGTTQDQLLLSQGTAALYAASEGRLKADIQALLGYANDYDDTYPLAGKWMDGISAYRVTEDDLHSPAVELSNSAEYGYAMESSVAGRSGSSFPTPDTEVALFDSTDLERNATDPVTTLPNPPRYGANNTIAFLSGYLEGQPRRKAGRQAKPEATTGADR